MDFIDAVHELHKGRKIRRKSWDKSVYLQVLSNSFVQCYRSEAVPFLYDNDIILSYGWLILGDPEAKEYFFPEAVEILMNRGKVALNSWPPETYLEVTPNSREIFMRRECEFAFTPTFECFMSKDWELIE